MDVNKIKELIKKANSYQLDDELEYNDTCEELTKLLTNNLEDTISYFKTTTANDLFVLSSSYEELFDYFKSNELMDTIIEADNRTNANDKDIIYFCAWTMIDQRLDELIRRLNDSNYIKDDINKELIGLFTSNLINTKDYITNISAQRLDEIKFVLIDILTYYNSVSLLYTLKEASLRTGVDLNGYINVDIKDMLYKSFINRVETEINNYGTIDRLSDGFNVYMLEDLKCDLHSTIEFINLLDGWCYYCLKDVIKSLEKHFNNKDLSNAFKNLKLRKDNEHINPILEKEFEVIVSNAMENGYDDEDISNMIYNNMLDDLKLDLSETINFIKSLDELDYIYLKEVSKPLIKYFKSEKLKELLNNI